MEGKLGAFYIGEKQAGGFLNWSVEINTVEGPLDGKDRTHKAKTWALLAWMHWLHQPIEPGTKVRFKLCKDDGKGFWECNGKINCQLTRQLNTLIHVQLEAVGAGELVGKAV